MSEKMKVREAMIDQDGAVWEKIGGAWSLYKPEQSVPVEVFDSRCNYASFAGRVCNKCGRIHDDANLSRIGRVGGSPLYGESPASIPAAKLERLRKDAERYRWIRDKSHSLETRQYGKGIVNGPSCYHEVEGIRELKYEGALDDAIDAAIAQEPKK